MKLKSNLKKILVLRGITQSQVAIQTGLTPSTIGKLCRDYPSRFDAATLVKICEFLKIDNLDEIFELEE